MVTIESVLEIVPAFSIAVALVYYGLQVRNKNKARKAQVYIQIWDKFSSPEFLTRYNKTLNREWTDYNDYIEKYGSLRYTNTELYAQNVSVGVYFEGVGVLLKQELIDVQTVADLLGTTILAWWDKIGPLMKEYRVTLNQPRAYLYAEYLYDQIKQIVEKEHPEVKSEIPLPRPNR